MTEPVTIAGVLDDGALLSLEYQMRSRDVLGDHDWRFDLEAGEFHFVGAETRTTTRMHVLGTAAPGPRSWLWAWGGWPGCAPAALELAGAVRDFGHRHGIAVLTEEEVPFADVPGAWSEPNLVAFLFADVAKVVGDVWTTYTVDLGRGTRGAFLIEHPDFALPPPSADSVRRILKRFMTEPPHTVTDHRRALHGYAVRRGLDAEFNGDRSQMRITGADVEVVVGFRPDGLANAMSSSAR